MGAGAEGVDVQQWQRLGNRSHVTACSEVLFALVMTNEDPEPPDSLCCNVISPPASQPAR